MSLTASAFRDRNARTLAVLSLVALGMLGASYAAVPLYRLFCQVTGFGGTTQVAQAAPDALSAGGAARMMAVRFNSDISRNLPWTFQPMQKEVRLKVGEQGLAFFRAENRTSEPLTGTATFNVTPNKAGKYFNKVDCFCFTEQTLAPGQSVDMPVTFFIDPEIVKDANLEDVRTITLSYTFFPAPAAEGKTPAGALN